MLKKSLLFIICIFLLLSSSSCSKSNPLTNKNNSSLSKDVTTTQNNTDVPKNETSSINPSNDTTQNDDFEQIRQNTIELEASIKEKATLFEQLQMSLHELDRKDILEKNVGYSSVEFLNFAMKTFKDFLASEQAYAMTESDYCKLSEAIQVFPLKIGRVFTYCGSSLRFGDSGKTSFAFFQTMSEGKVKVAGLYDNEFKDILNVIQPVEDENLIVLLGRSRDRKPWYAFVEGFQTINDTADKIEILEDYKDDLWSVDSKTGTICLLHAPLAGTYINDVAHHKIEIEAGDAKLVLFFNTKSLRYSVKIPDK